MAEVKKTTEFKELPDPVKSWLASTQITFLVSELNRRLGFKEEEKIRVIPTMILRLAIADISPESFISELSKLLGVNQEVAKGIAKEIEEKMLRPIELILRDQLGIDVKLIHVTMPSEPKIEISQLPRPTPPPIPPRPQPPVQQQEIKIPINVEPSKVINKSNGTIPSTTIYRDRE